MEELRLQVEAHRETPAEWFEAGAWSAFMSRVCKGSDVMIHIAEEGPLWRRSYRLEINDPKAGKAIARSVSFDSSHAATIALTDLKELVSRIAPLSENSTMT